MQEKKNNAVEKAEKVANKNTRNKKKDTSKKAKTPKAKKEKGGFFKKLEERRREWKEHKLKVKEEKALLREQREKELEEKRIELARLKAHRKAEKEKAKATALRERNRQKMEIKKRKQELKAQKEARREMLKKESKKERQERILKEKQLRKEQLENKRKERLEKRKSKLEYKRAKREQKIKERQLNKERNKGVGGWIAAVISLGIVTLVLASVLTFSFLMPTTEDSFLEASYQKAFYGTVEEVDNIDYNLSKALVTVDKGALQKYLVDTAIEAELAENDLQSLPLKDESKYYTTKLINQIGDYSKYLNNKLINGESLTNSDLESLRSLYLANLTLKNSLQEMISGMGENFSFSNMLNSQDSIVLKGFDNLQNLSVGYPELIYDGPFSDGLDNREVKGITGAEISEQQAKEKFIKIFKDYNLEDIKNAGMAMGNIECYNLQAMVEGDLLYAQLSKNGGHLIMFSYAGNCESVNCDKERAINKAQTFLTELGIDNMKAVWVNLANNVYTINFAFEQNGVIIYSDLIKVRVCAESQMVLGIEATTYYLNHTERVIEKPLLTKANAVEKISNSITPKTARLVVVPVGNNGEKLCYEISGEYENSTYYIYIDAINGKQVEMFKVIETTEGQLLI